MLYPPGIFFTSLFVILSDRHTIAPHPLTPPSLFYSPPIFTNRTPHHLDLVTQHIPPPRRSRSESTDPQVWHIKLHIHFLSSDGNLIDAGCLAGMTALRHFRRPEVERLDRDDGMAAIWKVVSTSARVYDYKCRVIPRMDILRRLRMVYGPPRGELILDFLSYNHCGGGTYSIRRMKGHRFHYRYTIPRSA